jgi:hypothetical protein
LLKVLSDTVNLNPVMFRLFEDGSRGSRVLRVRQRADSNADEPWQVVGLPKDRRSTIRAKKVVNLPAACG